MEALGHGETKLGPEGFVFHWAHGREVRPGYLELDGMRYPSLPTFGETEAEAPSELPRPARLAINVARGRATFTARSDWLMELPRTTAGLDEAGATVWAAGAPPGTAVPVLPWVVRLEADGSLRHRALFPDLPEEPLPILGGAYVLLSVFRADHTSEVWILDGATLATVARLGLPHAVPPALHGTWVSGASRSAPPDPR